MLAGMIGFRRTEDFERAELYPYFAGQINFDALNDLCVVSFPGSAGPSKNSRVLITFF